MFAKEHPSFFTELILEQQPSAVGVSWKPYNDIVVLFQLLI